MDMEWCLIESQKAFDCVGYETYPNTNLSLGTRTDDKISEM
jgi:hypothetical protein